MCYINEEGNREIKLLHSKLKTSNWPNFNQIMSKIVDRVPKVNITVFLYEKEKDDEEKKEDSTEESKLQGIRLNVYRYKNDNINTLSAKAKEGNI
jgi:hypothetical protein